MFNSDLKTRFISSYSTSLAVRRACVSVFNAIQRYEEKYGKDIYAMRASELQPILNGYVGIRDQGKGINISIIESYIKWCMSQGIDGAVDGFSGIVIDKELAIRTHMVPNATGLQACLDMTFDPVDKGSSDNIFRGFYWLAYAGVPEHGIFKAKSSNLDLRHMRAMIEGDEYKLSRESIQALRFCAESDTITIVHPNFEAKVERPAGDELMRSSKGVYSPQAFRVALSRASSRAVSSGRTEVSLSYYRVWLSGVFYRLCEREAAGFVPDFESVAEIFYRNENNNADDLSTKKIRRAANDYERDYVLWKRAFHK